jgi:hypothetical protein
MVGQLQAPIDYFAQLAPYDIGASIDAQRQQRQQQALLQAQQQRAAQQQAQLEAAQQDAIKNPSAAAFSKLLVLDPKAHEGIKAAWGLKDEAQQKADLQEITAIDGLLAAGRHDEAKVRVKRRRDADAKAGLDTEDDDEMLAVLDEDPAQARLYTGSLLAGILGDKAPEVIKTLGEDRRADAELPTKIASTTASTAKTLAEAEQVAPNAAAERDLKAASAAKMAADVDTAAARLGLDRERLSFDIDAKNRELGLKEGELSDGARSAVNQAVIGSVSSRQLATRAATLADKFQEAPAVGGKTGATWANWYAATTGDASAVTQLRREYTQLRASQAVKNLPPGPASDKDIQLALKGFPSDTDNRETLVSFLRGMEKLNNLVADQQDRQADWLAGNKGSLGPARAGFFVGNTFVQPGTRFDDIEKANRKEQARAAAAARVAK